MRFSAAVAPFLELGRDRRESLACILDARALPYSVLATGKARHFVIRIGRDRPRLVIAAHYDRVLGSPGVLDNACACLQLMDFAARQLSRGGADPSLLVVFTDAEEIARISGARGQGAFGLARALASAAVRGEAERRPCQAADGGQTPAGRQSPSAGQIPGRTQTRIGKPPSALVLDVTGRGDRILLSSAPAGLLARNRLSGSAIAAAHEGLAALCEGAAAGGGLAKPLRAPLPWSDDLGLVLGGVPAITASLLPYVEAEAYVRGCASGSIPRPADQAWPRTWRYLHGSEDGPGLAQEAAFGLMGRFLDGVAKELYHQN